MKRIITIIFIFSLVFPISCDQKAGQFYIDGLTLKVGKVSQSNGWNEFQEIDNVSLANDTLAAEEVVLGIFIESARYVSMRSFGFISSAHADQADPNPKSKVSLISIYSSGKVHTDSKVYDVGENLRDIFMASGNYGEKMPVLEFTGAVGYWERWDDIYLYLNSTLTKPMDQAVQVKVTMDDGTVFEMETPRVMIK